MHARTLQRSYRPSGMRQQVYRILLEMNDSLTWRLVKSRIERPPSHVVLSSLSNLETRLANHGILVWALPPALLFLYWILKEKRKSLPAKLLLLKKISFWMHSYWVEASCDFINFDNSSSSFCRAFNSDILAYWEQLMVRFSLEAFDLHIVSVLRMSKYKGCLSLFSKTSYQN